MSLDIDRALRRLSAELHEAGMTGSFVVRDLDSGQQIEIEPDAVMPIASIAKIPIVLTAAIRMSTGSLNASAPIEVLPTRETAIGLTGLARFRHPARVAVEDLASLALTVSDNAAADALLDLVSIDGVRGTLTSAGIVDIIVRHPFRDLADTPLEQLDENDAHLAYELSAHAQSGQDGHAIWQLDTSKGNVGTATALADLLHELWRPSRIDGAAAERVRKLMAANAIRHRLAPDLDADDSTWASKTGTLLGFRHEAGVLERGRRTFAIVAMSSSSVAARTQPAAEATLGHVARQMVEMMR